jgi:hypothetical protein
MNVSPAPGWVWTVTYQWDDDQEVEAMVVVALTVEKALLEAHWSLEVAATGYTIYGVARVDVAQ